MKDNTYFSTKKNKHNQGFTLIEVLVALAIIAIALTAIIKASSSDIEDSIYLQNKNIAVILANNILSEAKLGLISPATNQPTKLLNTDLYWTLIKNTTPDVHVQQLTVTIKSAPNTNPLLTVWGFSYE